MQMESQCGNVLKVLSRILSLRVGAGRVSREEQFEQRQVGLRSVVVNSSRLID
jgi:hypothetical protein